MKLFTHKKDLVAAANHRGFYDQLCEALEIAYGWDEETDEEYTGEKALGDYTFAYIIYNTDDNSFNGYPTANSGETQITGDDMLDLILRKNKVLGIQDVFVLAEKLTVEDVQKLLRDFKADTGREEWNQEDAARLLGGIGEELADKYAKVVFYDKHAGLDAVGIDIGDATARLGVKGNNFVCVDAAEFKRLFKDRHGEEEVEETMQIEVPPAFVEEPEINEEAPMPRTQKWTVSTGGYIISNGTAPDTNARVEVLFRCGEIGKDVVDRWRWDQLGSEYDIMGYRILEEDTPSVVVDLDGFIPSTGVCPEGDPRVLVKYRGGFKGEGFATDYRWTNTDSEYDIVGYKVIEDPTEHLSVAPVYNPKPRYRKRRQKPPVGKKTIVRVLYTTQQTYTFKNVAGLQIIEGEKATIEYRREIEEGISEVVATQIEENLLMAIIVEEDGKRSNFLRNIDGTWDFNGSDGTVILGGSKMVRFFA